MDPSLSNPPGSSDDPDEPQLPPRSPSRLDFCMEDPEDGHDVWMHGMDWACAPTGDGCPYAFLEEDTFALAIAATDRDRARRLAGGGEDDPPQASNSHSPEKTNTSPPSPAPSLSMAHQAVVEPQAPIPVRPPSVHFQEAAHSPLRTAAQRLGYPHHGLSRSALLQQKLLWESRHEAWAAWQSRMEQCGVRQQEFEADGAYTGIATARFPVLDRPPPYVRTPPSGLERDLADQPTGKPEQDIHASIFPRVGDISALRDPYSVNVDRCFFKYPLWTLRKILYTFSMHQRTASSVSAYSTVPVQASTSSSTLSSYTSSSSGEDEESDSTLVADDGPVPRSGESRGLEALKDSASPHSSLPWNRFCGWEFSWYARWEVLIGLFQRDQAKCDALDASMKMVVPPKSKATSPSSSARTFRCSVEVEDDGDDDDDDDEEEDYGTLVSNPIFSVDLDEECERAVAFYNR